VKIVRQLWFQVLVGMVAGVALGWLRPSLGVEMRPLGDAFIALIRMVIGPVIFCTVVHGIAAAGDFKRVGRVAIKALVYFEVLTLAALVLALAAVNLWRPGAGMNIDPQALDPKLVADYAAQASHQTVVGYILHVIPGTFLSAFTEGEVLQVLFVSVLFAFALGMSGTAGQPVRDLIGALQPIFFRIVGFVMWAAPIGAFGAIAFTVGRFGTASLAALGGLIAEFFVVCAVFVFVVLGGVAWAVGVNLLRLLAFIRDELLVVAATTSSETVLPRLMLKLRDMGCEEGVVALVIPTGYSFNLDGTCLYLATAAVFLAQATNTPLDLTHQLILLAVLLLTSKGAAGVAGAAFVVLAATVAATGAVPLTSIAMILGIHRLLAEALTFVNVVGNCVATIAVARWEGAVDEERLRETVGFRRGDGRTTMKAAKLVR
jgi:aerobic C4-dicarboxylate transport protein